MATLIQSYPQQTNTMTMLQPRSGPGSNMAPSHIRQNSGQQPRSTYQGGPGNLASPVLYRGTTVPSQSYGYVTNPVLTPAAQWQAFRAASTSAVPTRQSFPPIDDGLVHHQHQSTAFMSAMPGQRVAMNGSSFDDSYIADTRRRVSPTPRPKSAHMAGSSPSPFAQTTTSTKTVPERYRRPAQRSLEALNSAAAAQKLQPLEPSAINKRVASNANSGLMESAAMKPTILTPVARPNTESTDDRHRRDDSDAQRLRRKNMPALSAAIRNVATETHGINEFDEEANAKSDAVQLQTARAVVVSIGAPSAPTAAHGRNESRGSTTSNRSIGDSRPTSANQDTNPINTTSPSSPTANPAPGSPASAHSPGRDEVVKVVQIPSRSSSTVAAKRLAATSPLSQPVTMDTEPASPAAEGVAEVNGPAAAAMAPSSPASIRPVSRASDSPAMQQLAAVGQKGGKLRSKSSRLRRVLSFGAAAELSSPADGRPSQAAIARATQPAKLQKEPTADELRDAEQDRIIAQQEAGGIGHSIYAGSKLFSSSTDNLSVSSTASSASIMLRKMGRGVKKGGRSLAGLFRPKSVIGVPAMDNFSSEGSQAAVSMVTAEAERELVNVDAHPQLHTGGGTGFPHLERNSLDAATLANPGPGLQALADLTDSKPTQGAVPVDIPNAVRKGILKRSTAPASSPQNTMEAKSTSFTFQGAADLTASPAASPPGTPKEEGQGHKRTGSVTIGNEDYFVSALRLRQDTKSAPTTPHGSHKRNATFNPRIMFHDTFTPYEYDRRAEISTCNKLTPILAQQIKEELNTFKMEMEVHETSKIYTHFF